MLIGAHITPPLKFEKEKYLPPLISKVEILTSNL